MDEIPIEIVELSKKLLQDNFIASLKNITPIIGKDEVNDVFLLETLTTKYILRINSLNELA